MLSKRNKQILLFFLRDKNKKNWFQIIKEFTTLYISKKELPLYYISNLLYRKNVFNYKDYLSLKENRRLLQWSCSHGKEQIVLAENKLLFEEFLGKNNIPTPQIYFHNSKNRFTYKGDVFEIETKKDLASLLEKVFNEEKVEYFFCKPIDGIMGGNIFIIEKKTHRKIADILINLVFSKAFIFQELIQQHEVLKKINYSSLNTLRIVTYKNKKNELEVLSGFIRVGRKGAIVDNAHAGGIVVPFNKETGKVCAEGLQLIDNGGGIFHKHPDTEVIFDNFQIPHYTQVKELVTKASSFFKLPLLGWDVAITPNGPIIVEVNHNFHLLLSDRMEKGLKRIPSFKQLLEQLK
ncbi:sugar-transfer associated ATP-grasp domain-containing protein [Arenibacter palladensis]|uniref:sugar-transfer associated ATP-grasp domain-containing protein n=1 Tax=Arenibacter palladensis TaxID=237373 RepID=UPI0026E45F84|nr:sugar-transfer associated ATP-grasp domain-containing protein [Arenibacter palladensis]MDO6605156.1 sugar-transfer associated ATP-grasp domain-containing protein [Arenibacter palladensis]